MVIAAAGQARPDWEDKAGEPSGPTGLGHSIVVAPDGRTLAEAGYGEEIIVLDIDVDKVAEEQRKLPVVAAAKR